MSRELIVIESFRICKAVLKTASHPKMWSAINAFLPVPRTHYSSFITDYLSLIALPANRMMAAVSFCQEYFFFSSNNCGRK